MIGDLVGRRYRITRQIAAGGMGVVCEAIHEGTGRRVALKIIRDVGALGEKKDAWLVRFRREAHTVGGLDTPHIIQVFDAGTDGETGLPFFAMELLKGADLSRVLKEHGPLPPTVALKIIGQACLALERAHDNGIIHRDIKPGNVFLAEGASDEIVVKVVDFGIAKVISEETTEPENTELTQTGTLLGTPAYMSPEQARGAKRVDHRADLWALSVVLYKALSDHLPHARDEGLGELIIAICTEPAPPIQTRAPWVPPEIAGILDRALQIDIANRFQSARQLRIAIESALEGGFALRASEIRPLTEEERSHVAPRYHSTFPPPPRSPEKKRDSSSPEESRTQPGFTRFTPLPNRKSRFLSWLALASLVVAVGLSALWLTRRSSAHSPREASQTPPRATSATPVAPPSASTPASAPQEAPKTVELQVYPPNARVKVDGRSVHASDGMVTLKGTLGSTHMVMLSVKGARKQAEVAITETGAVPSKLTLKTPREARPAPRPKKAVDTKPRAPVRAHSKAKPSPKPPAPKSGVGVVQVFE